MNKPPKPYQEEAIKLGWNNLKSKGYYALYFEPQMGKTYTSIALMEKAHEDGVSNFLFLTSATLMDNTKEQIGFHSSLFSQDDIYIYRTTKMKTQKHRETFIRKNWKVCIVNYEAFASPTAELAGVIKSLGRNWMAVFDEETKVKNHAAKRSKNIMKMFQTPIYKIGLTGTPLAESNIDLFAPWEIRKKGYWNMTFATFKLNFCHIGFIPLPGGVMQEVIKGNKNTEQLKSIVKDDCFVAKREDWLDVPIEDHDVVKFNLDPAERKAYDEMKSRLFTVLDTGEIARSAHKIGLYNKFRKICGGWIDEGMPVKDGVHSKLDVLMEILSNETDQVIIWSSFVDEIRMIKVAVQKVGYTVGTYYGSDSMDDRSETITKFKAKEIRILIANPDAGAYGHSLQVCNNQIFFSLPSSYEKFRQAKDRIMGVGAHPEVFYRYLVAIGTVDEKILAALERKENASELFMNAGKDNILDLV